MDEAHSRFALGYAVGSAQAFVVVAGVGVAGAGVVVIAIGVPGMIAVTMRVVVAKPSERQDFRDLTVIPRGSNRGRALAAARSLS